ncbi:MAG: hypothetical protein JRJ66_12705 [Deltaproteobacteria bacterium]|nr:hypothetical protein [Deltaproteobacteria bacterium]
MLKSYPKEIILKDGTGVTVRFLQEGDEGALLEMYRRFPEEERWFLENDVQDPSIIKRWVETADVKRLVSLEMYRRFPEEERWFLENDVQDPSIIKRWVETADVKRLVSLPGSCARKQDHSSCYHY